LANYSVKPEDPQSWRLFMNNLQGRLLNQIDLVEGSNIHMKRRVFSIGAYPLLASLLSFGAQQTWTGEISDSMCGANHQAMAKSGQKVNRRDCALECVKAGNKYVFVSKGQMFDISNQNLPDLGKHAGHKVLLTGDLGSDNKTITVAKVQMTH
jgi:hypothetical protein